jgi:tetrahydromethanopterin S-methyltransferase subunit G
MTEENQDFAIQFRVARLEKHLTCQIEENRKISLRVDELEKHIEKTFSTIFNKLADLK